MEIFEINGKYFTCKDLAELQETISFVKTHKLNDTPSLDVQRELDQVIITDDYGNEISVDFDIELTKEKVSLGEDVLYHHINYIKIFGVYLEDTQLSDQLKKRIREEVEDVAIYYDEIINK